MNWIDLGWPLGPETPFWPTDTPMEVENLLQGPQTEGFYVYCNRFQSSEHLGTHVDAPAHFNPNGRTLDLIPLSEWGGPLVRIDLRSRASRNRNTLLDMEDLLDWERRHGFIPRGAWVLLHSGLPEGLGQLRERLYGTAATGETALHEMSFPGFDPITADFLLERGVAGLGTDTPSIDGACHPTYPMHQKWLGADRPAVEHLRGLEQVPEEGAHFQLAPLNLTQGSGAPTRAWATWD